MQTKRLLAGAAVAAALSLGAAEGASAQLYFGGHGAWAGDFGDFGIGAQAGWDLPALPVDVAVGGEYFFPDCEEDCGLWGGYLAANLRFPFPIVRPYITGGWAYRSFDRGESDGSDNGFMAGGGVDLKLASVRAFAEWTYEFLEKRNGLEQGIVKVGLILSR